MDWLCEVRMRLRRGNRVLFTKDCEFLSGLAELIRGSDHRTLVLWALDLAEGSVEELERRYPGEMRPRLALEVARDWAAGDIKMRPAQRMILDCHALAKELDSKADMALCHAVGQACSVVHTAGHSMGYPMYELTSTVYRFGVEDCREQVERRKREYIERLVYWSGRWEGRRWAGFMMR